MMKKLLIIMLGMFILLLVLSCATRTKNFTSTESTVFINGKKDKNPLVVILLNKKIKDKRFQVEIKSSLIPTMSIIGEMETVGEKRIIYVTGISFFDNWPNGWISGLYEASGKITMINMNGDWICRIDDDLEIWDIIEGQIRYYDNYYRNFQGLGKVRNRVNRLMEISRFLIDDRSFPGLFGDLKRDTFRGSGFTSVITPYLFPERYGFKKLKLEGKFPKEYSDSESSLIEIGAGLGWRLDYSNTVFPEYLQELRNSGTFWRDFEEGPGLFFSFYNLSSFFLDVLPNSNYTFYDQKE